MDSRFYVRSWEKRAVAQVNYNENYYVPAGINHKTVLCGEETPYITDFEIYQLK